MAPDLIGCLLVKKRQNEKPLWGVIVETEAYSQSEPACHGYRKRTARNETLFGPPGRFYVYLTYGTYFCVNIVTDKSNWANGVLLRSIALPNENERIASGPGLIAKRFELNQSHDNLALSVENGIWVAEKNTAMNVEKIINSKRIGISNGKDLSWRWYLHQSRSVSKRVSGDRIPSIRTSWKPCIKEGP